MRTVVLAVGCVLAVWACSSEESGGGGSGGSAGSAGTSAGGNAGSGGSSTAGGTGGSSGSSGSAGSASTGGAEDAGMDVMLDVYVYPQCEEGCNKTIVMCNGTAAEIEECISTCTAATLGTCGDEMKALVACLLTSGIQCNGTRPMPTDCGTEAQAFSDCEDNN
ncbi:MAG: hypothetical protein KC492_46010 [Myxococcales bacterium]|nr:hypothetical protein [Myxococcales bacterium]